MQLRPPVNFTEVRDISGEAEETTKLGMCKMHDHSRSGCISSVGSGSFDCVEKKFDSDEYNNMEDILEKHNTFLKLNGPCIYHKDKDTRTMYMEYIKCDTLEKFLKDTDITTQEGKDRFIIILKSISTLLGKMEKENICHTDFHPGNLMVCDDMSLKIIDFGGIKEFIGTGPNACVDRPILISEIISLLIRPGRELRNKQRKQSDGNANKNFDDYISTLKEIIAAVPDMNITTDRVWRGITRS